MPLTAHPAITDVQALYAASGLVPDATAAPFNLVPWAAHLATAIAAFATRTGRRYPAVQGSRSYDPPINQRGILALGQDLASDGGGSIVVTSRGITQVSGIDYYLGPPNADNEGKPWLWLELPSNLGFPMTPVYRKSIVITGPWGASATIPDDVWEAERQYAAALCAVEIGLTISSGLYKVEEVTYGSGDLVPLSAQANVWRCMFETTVKIRLRVASWI